jgi:putative transposase
MRKIDTLHLDFPLIGSRSIRDQLARGGNSVCRDRVRGLMRKMGTHAIYRAPTTSIPLIGHKIYPYLLNDLAINCPNQVWATDITYIPMAKGFAYLVAIVNRASRNVLARRIPKTLTTEFVSKRFKRPLFSLESQ